MSIYFSLKELLEKQNVTQKELSEYTGLRLPTISDICNNKIKALSVDNLQKICDYLNCQPGDFIENVTLLNTKKRRMLMSKDYTIPTTTKEERKKQVNDALAMSTLGAPAPTSDVLELSEQFIEGNVSKEELFDYVLKKVEFQNEEKIYDVNLRKEVLGEYAASIIADYAKHFIKKGIDENAENNKNNPLVKEYWEVVNIKRNIVGTKYYRTFEDLKKAEDKLTLAKEKIDNQED